MTDLEERVAGYAGDAVAECSLERITAVSRFQSGERHAVFRVSYIDPAGRPNDLVVRVANSDEARDCALAEREAAVLRKVQGIAAPFLFDFRCESEWFDAPATCMQFVAGEKRELADAALSDIESLGVVVAQVHGLPIEDLHSWFPTTITHAGYRAQRVDVIARKLTAVRDPMPVSLQQRLRRAWQWLTDSHDLVLRGKQTAEGAPVLQHGDVAGGNVVWAATPVLIDWEYARVGDPADEIAYIFGQNDLSEAQRGAFWRGYRGASGGDRKAEAIADRVGWWEPVNLLGSALWWVERWAERAAADTAGAGNRSAPKEQGYYLDHAVRRLERLERIVDSQPLRP